MEDQERVFQRLRTEMTEEMRESEKASAGTEGRAHFAVGWGGSCSALSDSDRRKFLKLGALILGMHSALSAECSHSVRAFPRRFPNLPLCVVTGAFRYVHLLFHDSLVTNRVEGCTSQG